jgi:hypothetical protein
MELEQSQIINIYCDKNERENHTKITIFLIDK